jgi:hypothetical protein
MYGGITMKEFKLTNEEEKELQQWMKANSTIEKCEQLSYGSEADLEYFIEELQSIHKRIKENNQEIIEDSMYVAFETIPDEYEDYDSDFVNVYYSVTGHNEHEYEKRKKDILDSKRRRYEEYLKLKKEFGKC